MVHICKCNLIVHQNIIIISGSKKGWQYWYQVNSSAEMIPVNPKDLVMAVSPMDVDTFVYRSNQVSQH